VFDPERVVAFPSLSLAAGAVKGWDRRNAYTFSLLESVARHYGFDIETPFEQLPPSRAAGAAARLWRDEIEFVYEAEAPRAASRAGQALAPVRRHHAQLRTPLPRDRFGRGARGPGALPGAKPCPPAAARA
jgi:excinuclease ABC subunit A